MRFKQNTHLKKHKLGVHKLDAAELGRGGRGRGRGRGGARGDGGGGSGGSGSCGVGGGGGGSGGGSAADEDARQWQWVSAGVAGAPPAPIDVGWAELTDPHVTVRRWWDAAATTRRRVDAVLRAPADFGSPEPRGTPAPDLPIGPTILIECQSTTLAAGRLRLNIQTLAKLSSV